MCDSSKVPSVRPPARRRLLGSVACAAIIGLGCTGKIGDGNALTGGSVGSGGGASSGTGGSAAVADPNAAGVLALRRLTAREYLNTARDLLGDTTLGVGDVPNESDDLSNNAFPFRQPTVIGSF